MTYSSLINRKIVGNSKFLSTNIYPKLSYSSNLPKSIKILHKNVYPKYGEGSWLYDYKDTKYLDLTSGIGVLSTGHSHPYVIEKVKNQIEQYVHMPQQVFNIHESSNELLPSLLSIMPSPNLNSVFFVNSGSEATDNAIKIARAYTKKQNIITMKKGFHGRTYGALSITSSNLSCKKNINPLLPGVYYSEINNIDSFKDLLTYNTSPDETACVIYEPVQGEGGVFSLEEDFLKYIHEICNDNNILTIADEVQCGFGRTGTYWNVEQKNVIPDILTFGKGIGSGYPIAGLVGNRDILDNVGTNFLGGTYGGNAVSCAASKATIDIMKNEHLLDNVNKMGLYLKNGIEKLTKIKQVRQYGLMISIELINPNDVHKIVTELNNRNILVLNCGDKGQYIRLLPPLNIKKEECDLFLDNLENIFTN
tara:strand:- start:419 stop:1681 length:1263 start_codon:yes stop_codon:yes gene_type:complete